MRSGGWGGMDGGVKEVASLVSGVGRVYLLGNGILCYGFFLVWVQEDGALPSVRSWFT